MTQDLNRSNEQTNNTPNEKEMKQNVAQPRNEERASEEVNEQDMKKVTGGSSLTSGGNDFGSSLNGSVTISNSSNGTAGDRSYSNDDSHTANFGFGQQSQNTGY